ncbi:MAG: catalase [candidate division WS1 bacterium]|jgi:catalase|nr:catalase [candidate division WS1 bacterium]
MDTKPEVNEESKQEQLEPLKEDGKGHGLTTNQGVKIEHTDDALKAGERGPTLMEDFHFREKLTHFDHEIIPERVVHARGSGAHGVFECTEDMSEYTMASFLSEPGKKTPVFVRFSQVVGFRGSADTVRDARGFATKFYTDDGNYDLVGNNIPIFFIQDAMKFPDLVHSIKPEPDSQMPQASAAHDTFWDFISQHQETTAMIMWLLSDRGINLNYRMMEGFGVNTYRFVNAEGKARFVKFHWKPAAGLAQLVWDEAQKIAGKDPDFQRRDLWDSIEKGNYPEFEFGVQMIDEENEFDFDFDVLDPTKFWPEEEVPVKICGKMTLNKNPDNFFAETEQVAFHPGNVVRGIDVSNDPLLQGRLFSYLDTQLIRLGGPNFHEIPINRPVAEVHNNQRDGYHRMQINKGKVSYWPNSLDDGDPHPVPRDEGGYHHYEEKVEGRKVRARSDSFMDFFSQATLFWNSQTKIEKQHIIRAFHFEVGKVKDKEIKRRIIEQFTRVATELGEAIADGLGMPSAEGVEPTGVTKSSPAVSFDYRKPEGVKGRKIAVLATDGVDAENLMKVKKYFADRGAEANVVSTHGGMLKGKDGDEVEVDYTFKTTASVLFDALLLPCGKESVEKLKETGEALGFVNEMFAHCKPIAAFGTGVELLEASQIMKTQIADGDDPVSDQGVVSMRGKEMMDQFSEAFASAIEQHRHWDREAKMMVPH